VASFAFELRACIGEIAELHVPPAAGGIEPERFFPAGHEWEGHWTAQLAPFPAPDRALERRELRAAKFGSAWRIRAADADGWFEGSVPHTPPPRRDTGTRARRVTRAGSLRALEAT